MNNEGWICPKCGRSLAPWMAECPCNQMKVVTASNYPFQTRSDELNHQETYCDLKDLITD